MSFNKKKKKEKEEVEETEEVQPSVVELLQSMSGNESPEKRSIMFVGEVNKVIVTGKHN